MSALAYEKEQVAQRLHEANQKINELAGLLEHSKESQVLTRLDRDAIADELCEARSALETQVRKNNLLRESLGHEIAQIKGHVLAMIKCCHSHPGPCCGSPCGSGSCSGHRCTGNENM